ncbi:polysaccharide pyruvyl transferase family protein [Paracoccus sp. MBLB3053]|uniref:Polysaccharide pyruvyl transferase family protein n=1 Tax=Paracoccus aurantius TaxID=3073814 RepID=A0ABU2HUR4_9RHOB|nr:polysaccharide pyruvyl transferase family protein [Paracoccus sp. MBLB3053]MDS9468796.1 polysaccharide pyruvyl transferase family protein [Paracoccus sp. MBLB3053]
MQFAVPYSPNLGDGVISDCLAHALRSLCPAAEFSAVDLSGRTDFGEVTVRNRMLLINLLSRLPRFVRQRLVVARLRRLMARVAADWKAEVKQADLAILGGGQIFSDADLNFCMKIAGASRILRACNTPTVVYAAGVSRNWSARGAQLFGELAQCDLRFAGLRDKMSLASWNEQMATQYENLPTAELTRDPGLLARACYGQGKPSSLIGIGVMSPAILTYHGEANVQIDATIDFFGELAIRLADSGHRVGLFCNGAAEDKAILDELAKREPLARRAEIQFLDAPTRPIELAQMIGGFRAVVAHRLHACIVGYSYALPIVGLGWDKKVECFFQSVGLSRHFLPASSLDAAHAAQVVEAALAEGIDDVTHALVIEEAWLGAQRMLAAGLRVANLPPPQTDHATQVGLAPGSTESS